MTQEELAEVTQADLEKMLARLRERHCYGIPDDYLPSIERFNAAGDCLESVLFLNLESDSMPSWFVAEFLQDAAPAPSKSAAEILRESGIPKAAWAITPPHTRETPEKVTCWAKGLGGRLEPWLWVKATDERARLFILAQIVLAASRATGGRLTATYVDVRDLCGEYSAANLFGEGNRYESLTVYKRAPLLVLDNLGAEQRTHRDLDAIAEVIEARHLQMLPTVLASGAGLRDWRGSYGRIDADLARGVVLRIVDALGAFKTYASKEAAQQAVSAHVLELGT